MVEVDGDYHAIGKIFGRNAYSGFSPVAMTFVGCRSFVRHKMNGCKTRERFDLKSPNCTWTSARHLLGKNAVSHCFGSRERFNRKSLNITAYYAYPPSPTKRLKAPLD